MKQVVVGTYEFGFDQAKLVLREGTGGSFWVTPYAGKVPLIEVGADQGSWADVMSCLLHEALELQLTRIGSRYNPSPDFGRDHSSYLFVMPHHSFSEAVARVAPFLASALPDLGRAWKRWKKPAKKKRRKK